MIEITFELTNPIVINIGEVISQLITIAIHAGLIYLFVMGFNKVKKWLCSLYKRLKNKK